MSEVKVNKISPRTNCGTVTVGDSGDSVSVSAGVPVTVNGDLKSNALKATDGGSIISQSGTTITLGASGDTVSLASGASQSGFGREGSVDWQTSIKTSDFTAVSGEGYFVNTTSGTITVTLPASPSAGAIVAVKDYANTADTNAITLARNGSNIDGAANDVQMTTEGISVTIVYADATKGWVVVESGQKTDLIAPTFISATGGTITCCGNFKIHTFTSPGTFTVNSVGNPAGSNSVNYLVVAGGGGGSGNAPGNGGGGGGGAGGFRTNFPTCSGLPVSVQGYPITVGGGGSGGVGPNSVGTNGSNSIFSSITSTGGGRAGTGGPGPSANKDGASGGSGGGAGSDCAPNAGGSGNTPPVSPPQGNNGGNNDTGSRGAGGGGASCAATNITPSLGSTGPASNGGDGTSNAINGSATTYAGGGGGGAFDCNAQPGGSGGAGGGGRGAGLNCAPGTVNGVGGTANTGGGGGGGGMRSGEAGDGAGGGSGIVIIRYKFQ